MELINEESYFTSEDRWDNVPIWHSIYNDELDLEFDPAFIGINNENSSTEAINEIIPGVKVERQKSSRKDNIIRIIKVHFINFLIQFENKLLESQGLEKSYRFIKIDYNIKKQNKQSELKKFISAKIKDILCNDASIKFTSKKKNENRIIYEKVKTDELIKQELSRGCAEIFKNIYYNNTKIYEIGDKIIDLSNIETFDDYLKKKNIQGVYLDEVKEIVKQNFLPKMFDVKHQKTKKN